MTSLRKALVLTSILLGTAAWAGSYPDRPITVVVPFSANGPTDEISRAVGAAMGRQLKQQVVVENISGEGGTVGAAHVAKAQPDGYTLLMHHLGMATAPSLYPTLPFNPLRDFEFIGQVTDVPMTLVASPGFPAKNFKEMLAYVKVHRDKVRLGHAGAGSASHLCGLLLMSAIGIDLKTVTYNGTAPAMNDLVAGKIDLLCDQTTNSTLPIRAGNIKPLGITTARRIASLPNIPTLQESGLKNFELVVWHALYAPKGTPPQVIEQLTQALQAALQDWSVKARFKDQGTNPVPLDKATPQYARKLLGAEIERWAPIVKRAVR